MAGSGMEILQQPEPADCEKRGACPERGVDWGKSVEESGQRGKERGSIGWCEGDAGGQ